MILPPPLYERLGTPEIYVSEDNATVDLTAVLVGTGNFEWAVETAKTLLPLEIAGAKRQSFRLSPLKVADSPLGGASYWEVTAHYEKKPPKSTGESSFSFETTGGTAHITQSKETVGSYARVDDEPPDFKGAIGVNNDSVEGADITIPVYNFKETHYLPVSVVTETYKHVIYGLTGKVNNAPFRGFNKGDVLFLGASGSQRGTEDWEITFNFAASPTVENLVIGDIVVERKEGWHYLWVRYEDVEDEGVLVKQPTYAYVERVYDYGNFSLLGIGT